jgi:hypothetical protein
VSEWENLTSIEYLIEKNGDIINQKISHLIGEEFFFNLRCEGDFLRAYRECSPLKSLIGKRAKAFNTGEVTIMNANTKKKAVGSEVKKMQALLDKPNVLQTHKQFFAQQNTYIDIFGYCPVLRMRPVGMDAEISAIWNLPPWMFDIRFTNAWLNQTQLSGIFKNFTFIWMGQKIQIDMKDLVFIFDDSIGTDKDVNLLIPDSRLVGLENEVSNIIATYKSRNTLITRRGAMGVLGSGAKDVAGPIALDPEQKDQLQKDFKKYGLVGQPYQVIISDANLQWTQIGFPTKDLLLFDEIDDDINRLCDAYGWPIELMSRTKDVTFDNKKQAMKSAYRDTIIPESESRMEQFTMVLFPDPNSQYYTAQDFDDVEILQDDKLALAQARKAMDDACTIEYNAGLITKNMWLIKLGEEPVADPTFDEYKEPSPPPTNTDPNNPTNTNNDTNNTTQNENQTSQDSGTTQEGQAN